MSFLKKLLFKNKNCDSLSFIRSEDKRLRIKPFLSCWEVSPQELKVLYLNNFISIKSNETKVTRLPFMLGLNIVFSTAQLVFFSCFLIRLINTPQKPLAVYLLSVFSVFIISVLIFHIYKTMVRPIKLISQHYHFLGKYNHVHDQDLT